MIKLRKHIALLLFGIFLFPILFQSIHVVWHHSRTYICGHNLCSQTITNKDFLTNGENISEKEKICPICEYQFSINDLPKISFYSPAILAIACNYIKTTNRQRYKQVVTDKTSRAPPVIIS